MSFWPAMPCQAQPISAMLRGDASVGAPCSSLRGIMKNFILGVLVGSLLLILGVMAYLRLGLAEVRADLPPPKFETQFMRASVHASVRRKAPEATNPVSVSDENMIAGGKLYANNCAGCHGNLESAEDIGGSLFPPIPQFAKIGTT